MKPKKGSKNRKRIRPRRKVSGKARSSTTQARRPEALTSTNPPVLGPPSGVNGCEEVEVGDIGGFGDAEELEAHEKRCGEKATEFCHACARNLCRSHYELLHMDHDTTSVHNIGKAMTTGNQ